MKTLKTLINLLFLLTSFSGVKAQVAPYELNIDTQKVQPPESLPEFSATNPEGIKLSVNSRYFEKNDQPWFPLMGEFHYWRFPSEYWEEQIVKMKSAGLQIVATYVYWGAHEKPKGTWKWSDRLNLRHFVELCQKHGMYVWLRPGPYINGDVRGHGFPDWVNTMPGKRSNKQAYLDEVATYFNQVGQQTKGLYFKEGGPVIGVQLENEYASGNKTHIARLKELAINAGIAPVYWSVTANSVFQDDKFEVLPLQGAYCYRGWESGKSLTTDFLFAQDQWIMDINFGRLYYDVEKYPRATCEQGAGMQETHKGRFIVEPQIIEAHAHNQVGRGINMLGYFMFQGGTQYPGTEMPESDGPMMPSGLVSYDYQAPLDEFGRMADSYKYLKLHHLFLADFGDRMVTTSVFRPQNLPTDPADLTHLRYTGRFNQQGQGFVFICNAQNYRKMTAKQVQMKINLTGETILFPRKPVTIQDGKIVSWPVNFPFGGINIKYATAQILCKVNTPQAQNLFLYETEGIPSEICLPKSEIKSFEAPGCKIQNLNDRIYFNPEKLPATISLKNKEGKKITLTILSRGDAENAWKCNLKGQDYLFLSQSELMYYPEKILARQLNSSRFAFRVFPELKVKGASGAKDKSGIFKAFSITSPEIVVPCKTASLNDSTTVITVSEKLPAALSDVFAEVNFRGDIGIATLGKTRVADRLFYGKEWTIGLKRFIPEMLTSKEPLKIEVWGKADPGVSATSGPKITTVRLMPEYEVSLIPDFN